MAATDTGAFSFGPLVSTHDAMNYDDGFLLLDNDAGLQGDPIPSVEDVDFDTFSRTIQQHEAGMPPPPRALLKRVPEATDDYLRNFFLRNGMHRTMEIFEIEWYEKYGSKPLVDAPVFSDNYLETAALQNRIDVLEHQLRQHAELTTRSTKQFLQTKKERDFHRANYNRVVQEKNKVSKLLSEAQHQAEDINPTLQDLRQKCETLHKSKTLLMIERDKLEAKAARQERLIEELQQQQKHLAGDEPAPKSDAAAAGRRPAAKDSAAIAAKRRTVPDAPDGFRWPPDERPRPSRSDVPPVAQTDPTTWNCHSSFKAHSMAVTRIAMHPAKPAVASCSDDGTWRLSALPYGELIMSGDGHRNWIAAVAMHPSGTMAATGSGDKTVRLWDFATNSCRATLKGHCDSVWCLDFQEAGPLLASGSLDQTARVWDVEAAKCRQTLRGHVDAVNAVAWRPYTNTLCTGSGDKTVSLWDVRTNCCVQTLYGHRNTVHSVAIVTDNALASCDADGVVALWDTRRMEQRMSVTCGPRPANQISADSTGSFLAVASDDATIKVIDVENESVKELTGHEDGVQCVVFDRTTNSFLVSGSSDGTICYWC